MPAIAGMLPTQRPPIQPTPVVRFTFSSSEKDASAALAFACAVSHACPKSGSGPPRPGAWLGAGGLEGSVSTKVPGTGGSEGTGNGVNDTGEIGIVMGPATYRSEYGGDDPKASKRPSARRKAPRTRAARSHGPPTSWTTVSAARCRVKRETAEGKKERH